MSETDELSQEYIRLNNLRLGGVTLLLAVFGYSFVFMPNGPVKDQPISTWPATYAQVFVLFGLIYVATTWLAGNEVFGADE